MDDRPGVALADYVARGVCVNCIMLVRLSATFLVNF